MGRSPGFARDARGARLAERLAAVELVDLDRPGGGGLDAQLAEDALVDVGLDDVDLAVGVGVDRDGADLFELRGEVGVAGDGVVDLDADERCVGPHDRRSFISSGIWEISSATVMPAASRR